MTRKEKLITRWLNKPKDFSYSELVSLLASLGYQVVKSGRTSGSRMAFFNEKTGHIIRLHRPHPGNMLKSYQLELIIEVLKVEDLI